MARADIEQRTARTRLLLLPAPFASTSHAENARAIGVVDMAYAIRDGRLERACGHSALHAVEIVEGILASARDGRTTR